MKADDAVTAWIEKTLAALPPTTPEQRSQAVAILASTRPSTAQPLKRAA